MDIPSVIKFESANTNSSSYGANNRGSSVEQARAALDNAPSSTVEPVRTWNPLTWF